MLIQIHASFLLICRQFYESIVEGRAIFHTIQDDILSKLNEPPRCKSKLTQNEHNVGKFLEDRPGSNNSMIMKNLLYRPFVDNKKFVNLFLVELLFDENIKPIFDRIPKKSFIDTGLVQGLKELSALLEVVEVIGDILPENI